MDFRTAADIIMPSNASARPPQSTAEASAQKKSAIRFLSDSLFTTPPKDGTEYNRLVSGVFKLMYVAQSDSTSDVCTVADECVARMIKSLGPRHGEIFCYNLFYALQSRKTSGSSEMKRMKNALVRLSDTIKYLPAYKEALSNCVGELLNVFVWYMSQEAALTYEKFFIPLLSDSTFPIRRCGSLCLVSLCEHYPVPIHAKLVDTLLETVSKEAASDDLKHGVLLFFLGIVKMKRTFIDNTDSMRKVSLKMLKFCLDNIDSSNHTIVSSSVDIINQLLTDYANNDILWTSSHYELWDTITQKLTGIAFGSTGARLSTRSSALGTLGLLFRQRPISTRAIVIPEPDTFKSTLEKLMKEHDQLFKDNLCSFLAGIIVGHLRSRHCSDLPSLLDVPSTVAQIVSIFEDPASMPGRPLCAALPELLNAFVETPSQELHKCAEDIMAALLRTKADRYWRVQVDVARALGTVNYHSFCSVIHSLSTHSVQTQSLELVAGLLGSNDSKVQTGAAEALVEIAELLCTETSEALLLIPRVRVWPTHPIASACRGVEVVVNLLIQKTLVTHSKILQKGVYRALRMLWTRYGALSGGLDGSSPNPIGSYAPELVPLLLERLAGSALSLDLECHNDMLALLGLLARENRTYFGKYAKDALTHCLRLMNIITRIMDTHTPPPPREFAFGIEYFVQQRTSTVGFVGVCDRVPGYQEIYNKLYSTYMITSSGNNNSIDKFSEMRPLVIRTAAAIIGCMDSAALMKYKDEVLYYLGCLFFHEPSTVLGCAGVLFQTLFSEEIPSTKAKLPRDKEGIFATWSNFCETRARRVPNDISKHTVVADFECFVGTAMKAYAVAVNGECKAAVLKFITTLVKCGVSYDIIDKSGEFTEMIISDCEVVSSKQQQRQFYNSTKVVLPALFDLLYTLFNDRSHYTKALTGSVLMRLAKLSTGPLRVFTPKSILSALRCAVPSLFALRSEAAPVSVCYCRDQVLSVALSHFPEPLAVDVALRIVFEACVHNKATSSWDSLSRSVLPGALSLIEPGSLHYIRSFEDFWRICALFEAISPKSLAAEKETIKAKLFVKYKHPEVTENPLPPHLLLPESTFGINHILQKLKSMRVANKMKREELLETIGKPELANFVLSNVKCVLAQLSAACLLSSDLRKCVAAMLQSAQKLITALFPSGDSKDAKDLLAVFWEQDAALDTLSRVLKEAETLPGAEFAVSVCRFTRALFNATGDGASLYAFYAPIILAKPCKECGVCPVGVVLLREMTILLTNWEGAKDTRIDPTILSKLFAVQQYVKTDVKTLNSVMNSPLNVEFAAQAAADGCLGDVITHRGASNYILAVLQLPSSKDVVRTIITRLLSNCKSLSFQRCTSNVLLRSIPELHLSHAELSELYSLFQAATQSDSLLPFSEVRNLFEELLACGEASGNPSASPPLPVPFEAEVDSGSLKCVKEADLAAHIAESRIKRSVHLNPGVIAPILAALGPAAFSDISSTGRLDPVLPELVASDVCSSLRGAFARYLKAQLDQSAGKLCDGIVSSSEWQRVVMLCSCVVRLGAKGHSELREVLTPEAQCEFAAAALSQFSLRRGVVTESSTDVVTVFDFASAALFDIEPPSHLMDSDGSTPPMSPELCKLVSSLYEVYECTVVDQSIQKFAPVSHPDKANPEAMLLSLIAGLIVGDLNERSVFGPSFGRSFEALLLTLTRLFPSVIYPIISNAPNPMSPLDIPLYEMCQGGNGMPEDTLRRVLRFITTVGLKSDSYFQEVHGSLRAILTIPDPASLYISESLQCLALRGITYMILGICHHEPAADALEHVPLRSVYTYRPRTPSSMPSPVYTAISAALADYEAHDYCFHAAPAGTDPARADCPARFSYNQLPLEDVRAPRKMKWHRLDLMNTVIEVTDIIETLLCDVEELNHPQDRPDGPHRIPVLTQLQIDAIYSLVLLSDLLGKEKTAWLQDLLARLFAIFLPIGTVADSVLMGNLVYGVLKCVAVTGDSAPATVKLVTDVVKYALESGNPTISVSALAGLRAIADAGDPKLLPPYLIGLATKHILAELSRRPYSERSVLHLLSSGFSLVRSFPSETEMSGFFDGLLRCVRGLFATQESTPAINSAVFHGFCTLIEESSLPSRAQLSLESFALKTLRELPSHATNSQRGLVMFGILLTSLYHADDRPITDRDKAVRNLFELARRGALSRNVHVLVESIARLVVDRMSPDVAVSLAVSELIKSKRNAAVTGLVVERVFGLVGHRASFANIVAASLRGILSCDVPYRVWMATCLLLAATDVPVLHALFGDTLSACKEDLELFGLVVAEFVERADNLSGEAKENLKAALGEMNPKVACFDKILLKLN